VFVGRKAQEIATTSRCFNGVCRNLILFSKVQKMLKPYLKTICRTLLKKLNHLIHMYYIFIYKIYIHKYFKEKIKCAYKVTTPTTLLKPTPAVTNLSYPCHFDKVTTRLRQVMTFCFLSPFICYLIDIMSFTFCRMS
jgi:hypothetical protein